MAITSVKKPAAKPITTKPAPKPTAPANTSASSSPAPLFKLD